MDEEACMVVIKEEEGFESEEEEEEDYEISEKMTSPVAVNWMEGRFLRGVVIVDDDALLLLLHSKSKSSDPKVKKKKKKDSNYNYTCCHVFDVCPICFDPWSCDGSHHQLCSLPCGHIYGRSCIIKSLQQEDQMYAGKCPQCNVGCTLKDVRPLYGTRLSIVKHKKASSSSTTTTRHFQLTKNGYKALKKHVLQRKSFALRLESVYLNRHADVLRRAKDASDRLCVLSKQRGELPKSRTGAEGHEADAFERQVLSLALRSDSLEQRAYALGKQVRAFRRLNAAYLKCIDYFEQMCKRRKLDAVLVED
ncbi:zinc finger, RING/FYVE/PHD-type containing protein [Tanacetum coccineum]